MTTTSERVQEARTPSRRSGNRLVVFVSRVREAGLLVVLLLIVLVVGVQVPEFFTLSNMVQILLSVSILAIVAIGETLVVLTRNVDLSVGSVVGFTAFVAADLFKEHPGTNLLSGILLGCVLGLLLGALNGLIVTWGRVPAIVATLGTLYVYRGFDFLYARGNQVSASDVPDSFLSLATTPLLGVPLLIWFAAVLALIFGYWLHASRTGRQLYAIGSNPEAARLIGLRSGLLVFGAFAISGLLSGLAGVLWGARFATVNATAASGLELQVIAAVVVGGVNIFGGSGKISGAMLGAIVLGTIDNSLSFLRVSQFWLQAIDGAAILIAVTLDAFITRWVQRLLITRRQR
ncbi:MAG TPA: ABC transporter permease [Ktedonosporobacter sp.]|nr:ABC transporter permease [Ktedonosporobacter sp.]